MITITMTCDTCGKNLAACEFVQHSKIGQDLELWSVDGHVVRFTFDSVPVVYDCPRDAMKRAK